MKDSDDVIAHANGQWRLGGRGASQIRYQDLLSQPDARCAKHRQQICMRSELHRALRCEAGLLSRADGSARWTQDGTEVIVGVYGPRQTAAHLEDAEKASISLSYNTTSGLPGGETPSKPQS